MSLTPYGRRVRREREVLGEGMNSKQPSSPNKLQNFNIPPPEKLPPPPTSDPYPGLYDSLAGEIGKSADIAQKSFDGGDDRKSMPV